MSISTFIMLMIGKGPNPYHQKLKLLNNTIQGIGACSVELKRIRQGLIPEALFTHGLQRSLTELCQQVSSDMGFSIFFSMKGELIRYFPKTELGVFKLIYDLVEVQKQAEPELSLILHLTLSPVLIEITFSTINCSKSDNFSRIIAGQFENISQHITSLNANILQPAPYSLQIGVCMKTTPLQP